MKKLGIVLFSFLLIFGFVSCDSSTPEPDLPEGTPALNGTLADFIAEMDPDMQENIAAGNLLRMCLAIGQESIDHDNPILNEPITINGKQLGEGLGFTAEYWGSLHNGADKDNMSCNGRLQINGYVFAVSGSMSKAVRQSDS